MSDPGDKISAAISRHSERWDNHLAEVVAKSDARDALTNVAAGSASGPSSAATNNDTEGQQ